MDCCSAMFSRFLKIQNGKSNLATAAKIKDRLILISISMWGFYGRRLQICSDF